MVLKPTVVFRNRKKAWKWTENHIICTNYVQRCWLAMASACDGWITRPRGKQEGLIHDEIKIQVLIKKDIARLNSNCVFLKPSSIPTKTSAKFTRHGVVSVCCTWKRHPFSRSGSSAGVYSRLDLLPDVLNVVITKSKQIANQWRGEDRRSKANKGFSLLATSMISSSSNCIFIHTHKNTHARMRVHTHTQTNINNLTNRSNNRLFC